MNEITPPPSHEGAAGENQRADRQAILSGLADSWNPREIRDLAASLLRLADSLDQDWKPSESRSIFTWPSKRKRIESNAVNLAMKARLEYERRRRRKDHLPAALLGEPAWDMLLDLFMQYAGGQGLHLQPVHRQRRPAIHRAAPHRPTGGSRAGQTQSLCPRQAYHLRRTDRTRRAGHG